MTKALIPLVNGIEEMEAVIIIDILRRAGWNVVSAGFTSNVIIASRGVKLLSDVEWKDIDPYSFDLILLPGGLEGTNNMISNNDILNVLRKFSYLNKIIAAICAAPIVLQAANITKNIKLTCHPALKDKITLGSWINNRVVIDKNIITSQGPGTAFEFALTIIKLIDGEGIYDSVAKGLVL